MKLMRFSILWSFFFHSVFLLLNAQEMMAPNDIPVPWYSQEIKDSLYSHSALAASLMVFDYYKNKADHSYPFPQTVEDKIDTYQTQYFLNKGFPFRARSSELDGEFYMFELDSLSRQYEGFNKVTYGEANDIGEIKKYIDMGIPVLVKVRYEKVGSPLVPGNYRQWVLLRGMDDEYIWINDPGYKTTERQKGENNSYPLKKKENNLSSFTECWTGKYVVIFPPDWKNNEELHNSHIFPMEILNMATESKPLSVPIDIKTIK